jgi:hypothetical protein
MLAQLLSVQQHDDTITYVDPDRIDHAAVEAVVTHFGLVRGDLANEQPRLLSTPPESSFNDTTDSRSQREGHEVNKTENSSISSIPQDLTEHHHHRRLGVYIEVDEQQKNQRAKRRHRQQHIRSKVILGAYKEAADAESTPLVGGEVHSKAKSEHLSSTISRMVDQSTKNKEKRQKESQQPRNDQVANQTHPKLSWKAPPSVRSDAVKQSSNVGGVGWDHKWSVVASNSAKHNSHRRLLSPQEENDISNPLIESVFGSSRREFALIHRRFVQLLVFAQDDSSDKEGIQVVRTRHNNVNVRPIPPPLVPVEPETEPPPSSFSKSWVLRKQPTASGQLRVVFFAGLEGTGHHALETILSPCLKVITGCLQ